MKSYISCARAKHVNPVSPRAIPQASASQQHQAGSPRVVLCEGNFISLLPNPALQLT